MLKPKGIYPLDARLVKRIMALMSWDKSHEEIFNTLIEDGYNTMAVYFSIKAAVILTRDYNERVRRYCDAIDTQKKRN